MTTDQISNMNYYVIFYETGDPHHSEPGYYKDDNFYLQPPVATSDDVAQLLWVEMNRHLEKYPIGDPDYVPRKEFEYKQGDDYTCLIKPEYAGNLPAMLNIWSKHRQDDIRGPALLFKVYAYDRVAQKMEVIYDYHYCP